MDAAIELSEGPVKSETKAGGGDNNRMRCPMKGGFENLICTNPTR
jgi:hypothetical protein